MVIGRWTSRALQLLGFTGSAVCLVLAVGILLGRSWVSVAVGDAFVTADSSIADGLLSIDDAAASLAAGTAALDEVLGDLGLLASTAPIPDAVAERISTIADAYAPARDRYVAAREQAAAALRYVQLAARVVPDVELPTGLADALRTADARLTGIDAALAGLRKTARSTVGEAAAAATGLRDAISAAADSARTIRAEADDLRGRITAVNARVDRVLWIGTGGLLLAVGYVLLLNAVIVWVARRRPRIAPADSDWSTTDPRARS
jgi:hypothetical protein